MKKGIKPPVVKGKRASFPDEALCPWCKQNKVLEPHSMAVLSGGALAPQGDDAHGGPTAGLKAYLSFHWHGAHDGGEGEHPETGLLYDIAQEVDGGLFDIIFCSVDCLRAFLNACLDEFEKKVKKVKKLKPLA